MKKINRATKRRNELDSMRVIRNIQLMHNTMYHENLGYSYFNEHSVESLREIEDKMIKKYNEFFK